MVNSTSNLYLTEQIRLEEYLLACRVGDAFYFYYWADAIAGWRQEVFDNQFDVDGVSTTTWRNSGSVTAEISVPGPGQASAMYFDHPAMPAMVQLGIMGHTWINSSEGIRADFDFIRVTWINSSEGIRADFDFIRVAENPPKTQTDCTTEFLNISQGDDLIYADGFETQQN